MFPDSYRADLAKLSEEKRWDFLRGKQVYRGQRKIDFDPITIHDKMRLAVKL